MGQSWARSTVSCFILLVLFLSQNHIDFAMVSCNFLLSSLAATIRIVDFDQQQQKLLAAHSVFAFILLCAYVML